MLHNRPLCHLSRFFKPASPKALSSFDSFCSSDITAATPAIRSACTLCPVGGNCLTNGLPQADMQRWAGVMIPHLPLALPGKFLYTAGSAADSVYVVRAGCIKTSTVDDQGVERIRGFWWLEDSRSLLVQHTDESEVEIRWISDPANPQQEPTQPLPD